MSQQAKIRLDQLVVERGLAASREAGKREILAGNVFVDGVREDKPGTMIRADAKISLERRGPRYASRGGEKLAHALKTFAINVNGRVAIDIGASTGGFTDVLLKAGASRVYCVDVGYGQLAWSLRQDPRVDVFDRTNARYITPDMFDPRPCFASVDVSFISLSKILPALYAVLQGRAEAVCLVKPQFEAGRRNVGKRGVVRDPAVHAEVLRAVYGHARDAGFEVLEYTWSPITGPEGNIEFLVHLRKQDANTQRICSCPHAGADAPTSCSLDRELCGIAEAQLDRAIKSTVQQAHVAHGRSGD